MSPLLQLTHSSGNCAEDTLVPGQASCSHSGTLVRGHAWAGLLQLRVQLAVMFAVHGVDLEVSGTIASHLLGPLHGLLHSCS
jgi:hypothetical protein